MSTRFPGRVFIVEHYLINDRGDRTMAAIRSPVPLPQPDKEAAAEACQNMGRIFSERLGYKTDPN